MNSDIRISSESCAALPWFAVRVRPQHERTALRILDAKGYEGFLPSFRVKRRWSDRYKETEFPLFPGYLFCRFDPEFRMPVISTPGVVYIVSTGNVPAAVDDAEVEAVRRMVNSGLRIQGWPYLQAGQRVRIHCGPLHGLEGVLLEVKNETRLVVSVTLLQRSVAAEIDRSWVTPVAERLAQAS